MRHGMRIPDAHLVGAGRERELMQRWADPPLDAIYIDFPPGPYVYRDLNRWCRKWPANGLARRRGSPRDVRVAHRDCRAGRRTASACVGQNAGRRGGLAREVDVCG